MRGKQAIIIAQVHKNSRHTKEIARIKLTVSKDASAYSISMMGNVLEQRVFDKVQIFCEDYLRNFFPTCDQNVYCYFVNHLPNLV